MRSWHSVMLAACLAACGTDTNTSEPDLSCQTSGLTYQTFGHPFVLDWCRGCHSSALPDGMRQGAPLDVNLDDLDHVRMWSAEIASRVAGPMPTMPPADGPSTEERELLAEWIRCGAPD